MDDHHWLTTPQVARYLGVVPRTVYALANSGRLISYRQGRVLRFLQRDVDAYLDGARVQPGDLDHLVGALRRPPPMVTAPISGQFCDCLLAGAIGDALGASVEFLTWADIRARHGSAGVCELPPGAEFTDDTQMTLFTAEGLIRASVRMRTRGITTHVGVGHGALMRWLGTQDGTDEQASGWLVTNELLHRRRSPGATCLSSLRSGRAGTLVEPLNDSKGCGAVMRMAPVGLWFTSAPERAWSVGCDLGAITHGHPDGYQPAGAFAAIVAVLASGGALTDAVAEAQRIADHQGATGTSDALAAARSTVAAGMPEPEALSEQLGEGWVGEEALAIAVACALAHPDDPLAALRAAVNHRGDSDSTGAITGNLLGLVHGTDWVPDGWIDRLDGAELVRTVARDFWTERYEPPVDGAGLPAESWARRYPPR